MRGLLGFFPRLIDDYNSAFSRMGNDIQSEMIKGGRAPDPSKPLASYKGGQGLLHGVQSLPGNVAQAYGQRLRQLLYDPLGQEPGDRQPIQPGARKMYADPVKPDPLAFHGHETSHLSGAWPAAAAWTDAAKRKAIAEYLGKRSGDLSPGPFA